MTPEDIERLDRFLVTGADNAFRLSAKEAGDWLECRPGCSECCVGPFPITLLDAQRLRRGLALLEREDPPRATAVRLRARAAIVAFGDAFPGDTTTGFMRGVEEAEERFMGLFATLPCPALDPVTRRCDLYEWRPISCRTFGPPVRIGGEDLPPCRLCFTGASDREIERCRVEIDPDDLEARILLQIEGSDAARGEAAETILAFPLAFAEPGPRPDPAN